MERAPASQARVNPSPGDLFTDRAEAAEVFAVALTRHRTLLDNAPCGSAGNRNVLVFHGAGGVGKSTLSRRLEAWAARELPPLHGWRPEHPRTVVAATTRVDLDGTRGTLDVESTLTALRHSLQAVRPRWPAFDFAFAAYRGAAHPGQGPRVPTTRARSAVARAVDDSVLALASALGASGLVRPGANLVRELAHEVRRGLDLTAAIGSVPGYADLLHRAQTLPDVDDPRPDVLLDLVPLLDHDLAAGGRDEIPLIAVFVDTVERLSLDPRRTGERALNRIVHDLPHMLFVLSGREPLDWHDLHRTRLQHIGSAIWPELSADAPFPAQHRLRNLSPGDARELVRRAREQRELPIPDSVVEQVVAASHGLPEYLNLALIVAQAVRDNGGGPVTEQDVTGSLGELVERVMQDVPEDEQRALRAGAMFAYFDTRLIAATAGVSVGCAERAVARAVIDRRDDALYPYTMHEEIRDALRRADHRVLNGWAEPDWTDAAERAVEEARKRHRDADERGDLRHVMLALGLAIGIACDYDVRVGSASSSNYADWLSRAIVYAPSIAGLRPFVPAESSTRYGRGILDFIDAKATQFPAVERRHKQRSLFESDHPLALPAGRHLGYALRGHSEWDEALAVFDELIERKPNELHRGQRALTLASARRFEDARAASESLTPQRRARLIATIQLSHGVDDDWVATREAYEAYLIAANRHREALSTRADLILVGPLIGHTTPRNEVEASMQEGQTVGHPGLVRSCLAACVLMTTSADEADDLLDRLEALESRSWDVPLRWEYALARAWTAVARGDDDAVRQVRDDVLSRPTERSRAWIPLECLLEEHGFPLPEQPTQWLEPYPIVQQRWRDRFAALRRAHTAP